MNNVEDFYSKEKLLKLVTYRTKRHNSFFYRVYTTNTSINIELNDDFIKAIKPEEIGDIKYIIQEWLNKRREEIEDHLVDILKTRLEKSREKVKKDFELNDAECSEKI